MNWNKAKNYLIIALLFVNLLLGTSIYRELEENRVKSEYSEEMEKHFHRYLDEHHIILDTTLPDHQESLSPIEISYTSINEKVYPKLFSDFKGYLHVEKNKKLSIAIPSAMILNRDTEPLDYTRYFIATYFPSEKMELKYSKEHENGKYFYYTPVYRQRPLEEAFLTFYFNEKTHTVNIHKINIRPERSSTEQHKISSPMKAIAQIVSRIKPGSAITDIKLVYYYRPEENSDLLLTEKARALPSWRIKTSSLDFYYVSAIH